MKKYFVIILLLLSLSACSGFDLVPNEDLPAHNQNANEEVQDETQEELDQSADCYGDEIHPAAQAIADEYSGIVDYEKVMVWYCNGAEFDDIMSALLTKEMVEADVEELLLRVADGESWNDIWLDLGIIEE